MTELEAIFAELGIQQYLHDFLEQGFDTWETILDITESDFDALGVKLGHRRKLQRKIANSRGISSDIALDASSRNTPSDDRASDEAKLGGTKSDAGSSGSVAGAKRKYRRHPRADEHAPERPPSAYVIFSNKMREDIKGQSLSFTEIAKLVGENWQALPAREKESYEQQASAAKERYNNEMTEYKKTAHYKEYQLYLADFKARQANQQQVSELDLKRPRIEGQLSATSTGSHGSSTSQPGSDTPTGRTRVESSASNAGQWTMPDTQPSPQLPPPGVARPQYSPPSGSIDVLPGYRDAILPENRQTLAWRDGQREEQHKLPGISSVADIRSSHPGLPPAESLSFHPAPRTGSGGPPPPPLLSRESTTSTNHSYSTPRTPLEPSLEPVGPSFYPRKSIGSYENQLPPFRPPSLSPQNNIPQHSPTGAQPIGDYLPSIAPMRGYIPTAPQQVPVNEARDLRLREYGSSVDANMDAVSALLKAGEVLSEESRKKSRVPEQPPP